MNIMDIGGYKAVIAYDSEINLFRSEFIELNSGADFYGADVDNLRKEGETALRVFLEMCREKGIEPRRIFSGKFNVRIPRNGMPSWRWKQPPKGKALMPW